MPGLHVSVYASTISRFGERCRDGQYSLASFLFAVLLLTVPPFPRTQPFVKVEAREHPLESALLLPFCSPNFLERPSMN